jgi:ubiquinone/menaquinone biosynthesis C-methylase UbiE
LSETQTTGQLVHEANIAVHKKEAQYYRLLHPEVYIKSEQKRITAALKEADELVSENEKQALDFGAGMGNLTEKLLALGYSVTAVDISAEMCHALRSTHRNELISGKLVVFECPIEDLDFTSGQFDLATCYSVLHHLPDYEATLKRLCSFVKKEGVVFLDHEASTNFWLPEPTILGQIVKSANFHSNPLLNTIYYRISGLNVPPLDYTVSDYWFRKEHHLDHSKILSIFQQQNFQYFRKTDYYSRGSWVFNPISLVYRHLCRPDMSLWVALK